MTTYTFAPDLNDQVNKLLDDIPKVESPPSLLKPCFEPVTIFDLRIECDPTLPPGTMELRGIADGMPYVKRFKIGE